MRLPKRDPLTLLGPVVALAGTVSAFLAHLEGLAVALDPAVTDPLLRGASVFLAMAGIAVAAEDRRWIGGTCLVVAGLATLAWGLVPSGAMILLGGGLVLLAIETDSDRHLGEAA